MDYLTEARRLYEEAIAPYKGVPVGATEAEVVALELEIGFTLPEAYRQYLLWMGKDYHGAFEGSEFFLYRYYLHDQYVELVEELEGLDFKKYCMPKHFLLFFHHQASEAAWFTLPKEAEDPLVYYFSEAVGMTVPTQEESFTQFLITNLRHTATEMPDADKERK